MWSATASIGGSRPKPPGTGGPARPTLPEIRRERARKGVLDTTGYTEEPGRSWLFRSIGYGHDESHWKDVVSTLRMVGYEGALSIEHEDSLTSSREGLEKAVDVLDRAVFDTQPGDAYWA